MGNQVPASPLASWLRAFCEFWWVIRRMVGFLLPGPLEEGLPESTIDGASRENENAWNVGVRTEVRCPRVIHYLPGGCLEMSESDVIANQKQILRNQKEIISNQKQIKSNQEAIKKNQGTILKNQGTLDVIVRNQKQILAAIKK